MQDDPQTITHLLHRWKDGDPAAEERLLALIYPQLHGIAARRLPEDGGAFTLQTTDLVHEAYLRLLEQGVEWHSRTHFFAITARIMRRVVVDYARRRGREKRGGGIAHLSFDETAVLSSESCGAWLDLDQALDELARIDGRSSQVVELRYFAGMTVDEVAEALDTSAATIARSWRFARAWLKQRIGDGEPAPA